MRRTATITIDAEGRDKGKVYLLTEMSASQGERWAMRAFLALAKSGFEVPPDIASAGLAGIAIMGIRIFGGMSFEDAELLANEMFQCISVMPDPARPEVTRGLVESDIEEIATRLRLRKEVFALHVDFSKVVALYRSARAAAGADSPTT